MASATLEDLSVHINSKISYIKKLLQLRRIGQEPSLKTVLSKISQEMSALSGALNKLELECQQQEIQQNQLKELQKSVEETYSEAQRLGDNIPIHLPRASSSSVVEPAMKGEEQCEDAGVPQKKKATKESKAIKEVPFITAEEFENVPAYMRGRLTYNQVNAIIQEFNKAVVGKYKIMQQPTKTMSSTTRKLYSRFLDEETEDTKGKFFIVEADVEQFTELKADKRFRTITTILRHCQRVREIRGSRLVRYAVC